MAIEGAPSSLVSINQTVLIFLGAAVTYKIVRDEESTILALLVKAMNKATKLLRHQQTVEGTADRLVQAAAEQQLQEAAASLLTEATAKFVHAVGMEIKAPAANNKPVAKKHVQDVACQLVQQAVRRYASTVTVYQGPTQEIDIQQVNTPVNELLQAMAQLIQAAINTQQPVNPGQQGRVANPGQQGRAANPGQQEQGANPGQRGQVANPGQRGRAANPGQRRRAANPGQQGRAANPGQRGTKTRSRKRSKSCYTSSF